MVATASEFVQVTVGDATTACDARSWVPTSRRAQVDALAMQRPWPALPSVAGADRRHPKSGQVPSTAAFQRSTTPSWSTASIWATAYSGRRGICSSRTSIQEVQTLTLGGGARSRRFSGGAVKMP